MQIQCTQCGASVQAAAGARFLTCTFCGSALYVDASRVVFHFVISPTIKIEEARGKLRRWMAGNETVKDLDVNAAVTHEELIYFPMWRFVVNDQSGDKEWSEPASSFSIADIKSIPLSGGTLQFFSPQQFEGISLKEPDVLLESAISWLEQEGKGKRDQIKETNLIHIPFYIFKYDYKGKSFQAVVDGTSGRVLTAVFPAKDELPFIGIALLAAFAFFVIGLLAPNLWIRVILYFVLMVPLAMVCYAIVRKY